MHILTISDVYFPRVGGVSTSIRTFCRELRAKGHETTLIAPAYDGARDDPAEDILRISAYRLPLDSEDRLMKPTRVLELAERLRGWNYDLIHVQTPFVAHYVGVALGRRLDLPVVETFRMTVEDSLHRWARVLPSNVVAACARRFALSHCRAVDALIVPSQSIRELLQGYGVTTPIALIPAGVDASAFVHGDGARFRKEHGIAADRPMLAYIGRVAAAKNIDFLVDVLSEVRRERPDTLLVVAGEGPAEAELRRLVAERDIVSSVLFIGNLDRVESLADCYRAADVFVFADPTEAQGLGLLEAMACGVPVVASAARGTQDVLKDIDGAVIAQATAIEFAAKVLELLRQPERRTALAAAGVEHVKRWSASLMAERLLDCYQEVLTGGHAHGATAPAA